MGTDCDPRVSKLIALFENLHPTDVARLGEYYGLGVDFKDPFNEIKGLPGVQRVFDHMFEVLHNPRFKVHDVLVQENQCFLSWDFLFQFRAGSAEQRVRGASHLRWDANGKIISHRDYWDAAEELYEKLPLVGSLMRWLRRRMRAADKGQG